MALIVGSAFFVMNQLGIILDGRATALVWLKAALTYLTPLLVSTVGVLSATRRTAVDSTPPAGRLTPEIEITTNQPIHQEKLKGTATWTRRR